MVPIGNFYVLLNCWLLLFFTFDQKLRHPIFFFLSFFSFFLNITGSCKNKISPSSESDMISKELESSHHKVFSVNLPTCQLSSFIAQWESHLREQKVIHSWFQVIFNCSYFNFQVEKPPRNVYLSINLGNYNMIEEKN